MTWRGPVEATAWPEELLARVITPGAQPCVHGYDVEEDLAPQHTSADLAYLALTGELPKAEQREYLRVASLFLAPLSVAHAPTHAAVLAQLTGGGPANVIAVAGVALSEQARYVVQQHRALLPWLLSPTQELPAAFTTDSAVDARSVALLRRALGARAAGVRGLSSNPTRDAALFSTLFSAGLTSAESWQTWLVHVRLPLVIAEALQEAPTNFKQYPMDLPRFSYRRPGSSTAQSHCAAWGGPAAQSHSAARGGPAAQPSSTARGADEPASAAGEQE